MKGSTTHLYVVSEMMSLLTVLVLRFIPVVLAIFTEETTDLSTDRPMLDFIAYRQLMLLQDQDLSQTYP